MVNYLVCRLVVVVALAMAAACVGAAAGCSGEPFNPVLSEPYGGDVEPQKVIVIIRDERHGDER